MIHVRPIKPAAAALALAGLASLDPRGVLAESDLAALCQHGQCFEAAGDGGHAVYVLEVRNGVAWVNALAGNGNGLDLVQIVDAAISRQADGLHRVALQTARPGLVRKLGRLGYRVTGWVMAKELH